VSTGRYLIEIQVGLERSERLLDGERVEAFGGRQRLGLMLLP
jgi:hypothetical protein